MRAPCGESPSYLTNYLVRPEQLFDVTWKCDHLIDKRCIFVLGNGLAPPPPLQLHKRSSLKLTLKASEPIKWLFCRQNNVSFLRDFGKRERHNNLSLSDLTQQEALFVCITTQTLPY